MPLRSRSFSARSLLPKLTGLINFESDRRAGLWLEVVLPEAAFDRAIELARRHVAKLGCRTLDTLHVACALELGAEKFWTFDERQQKLAKTVGLAIS